MLVTSKHFRVERIIFVLFPEGLSSHLCFFAISFLPIVSALRQEETTYVDLQALYHSFAPAPCVFLEIMLLLSVLATECPSQLGDRATVTKEHRRSCRENFHRIIEPTSFSLPTYKCISNRRERERKSGIPEAVISYRWQSAVMEKERSRVQSPDRATIRGIYQIGGRYWRGSSSASWAS